MEDMTPMSPGLDGWRQEKLLKSADPINPSRSRSCSPDRLAEKRENGDPSDEKSTADSNRALKSFKFALVEHLKDLLKPYWKDGKLSRDAYKLIVKKSVYKVIKSFGNNEIPSKRRINSYLKASDSKLAKLVEAYVEKYQKG